jgi:predicted transcriptional regulator
MKQPINSEGRIRMEYFEHVIKSVTLEDSNVLGILYEQDATAKVKAMIGKNVLKQSGLSEAKFRKVIGRLEALTFVNINSDYKEHSIFITDYGLQALNRILDTMKGDE